MRSEDTRLNGQEAKVALHDVREIFHRHTLTVWLDCGTLLGAVRGGTFIPWDDDIDLGMWTIDLDATDQQALWHDLNAREFNVYRLADKLILDRSGVPINISLFGKEGDVAMRAAYPLHTHSLSKAIRVLWWVSHARRQVSNVSVGWPRSVDSAIKRLLVTGYELVPGMLADWIEPTTHALCKAAGCTDINWSVPLNYFDAFVQIPFLGDLWPVPRDTEQYLQFRYGPDWRVPNENFSTVRDDGAVQR